MKSKNLFDHYKEPICKIWFDEKGYMTATEIGFELIRCKDCKHYDDKHEVCCVYLSYRLAKNEDDFCSDAERKSQ